MAGDTETCKSATDIYMTGVFMSVYIIWGSFYQPLFYFLIKSLTYIFVYARIRLNQAVRHKSTKCIFASGTFDSYILVLYLYELRSY